ncbi:MAG: carbamoyl phosphate synthase small subunit [Gammaproteobacteria bacterium]|nr:carbamoyl phosphate synthase small subunit [Gammaproteobacteria bacterium]
MLKKPALLALADGTLFEGISIGVNGSVCGEVVFNTSMTGYQEMITDPSYAQQLLTFTYPHIGNVGVNLEDAEAQAPWIAGLIIENLSLMASNFRSQMSLGTYLQRHGITAIAGIDTRQLTRHIRTYGAQSGCIMAADKVDALKAVEQARAFPGLNGVDLAKVVSTHALYQWTEGSWLPQKGYQHYLEEQGVYHIVAYDFGVKRNILRLLADQGMRITVVPATTSAEIVLALKPDGVFLSNGPGDPAACDYAVKAIQTFLEHNIPLFGICLGCQLLALASGAKTEKMKLGHHGANHPVQDLNTQKVFITSQNHGFAIAEAGLPTNIAVTHRSLFDNTIQGIKRLDKQAFAFQGHPEASPGPQDIQSLFTVFLNMVKKSVVNKENTIKA